MKILGINNEPYGYNSTFKGTVNKGVYEFINEMTNDRLYTIMDSATKKRLAC